MTESNIRSEIKKAVDLLPVEKLTSEFSKGMGASMNRDDK